MAKNRQRAPKKRQYVSKRQKMTNITIWAVLVAFVLGGVFFFTPAGVQIFDFEGNEEGEPILFINGKGIPARDFTFATSREAFELARINGQAPEDLFIGAEGARRSLQVQYQAKEALVRQTLVLEEANRLGIRARNTELDPRVNQAFDSFFAQQGYTEEQLRDYLDESPNNLANYQAYLFNYGFADTQSGTIAELRRSLREQEETRLKEEKVREEIVGDIDPTEQELIEYVEDNRGLYQQQIVGRYVPTDEEVEAFYNENLDRFGGEQVEARHILVRVPEGTADSVAQSYAAKAERLRLSVEAGGDFVELALANSDDLLVTSNQGNLGFFTHGNSRFDIGNTDFSDGVFELAVGEMGIVESDQGFHLVEVTDRRETEFDDVKDRVSSELAAETISARFDAWLDEANAEGAFPKSKRVKASHILFQIDPLADEDEVQSVSRKIDRVVVELKDGGDFAELANEYSEDPSNVSRQVGGDLGWYYRNGQLVPEFLEAMFSLELDEVSDPVRTQFGFHLIKVTGIEETDRDRDNARLAFIREQEGEVFDAWLDEQLETAEVRIEDPLLRAYNYEEDARNIAELEQKLEVYDSALRDYNLAGSELTVTDGYIGYYESEVHRLRINAIEREMQSLSEEDENYEERMAAFEAQIEQERALRTQSFLESVNAYTVNDEQVFERAVAEDPDSANLRFQYAIFNYSFKDDRVVAFEQLQEVINLDPEHWQAMDWAARIEMERENYGSAVALIRSALNIAGESSSTQFLELRLARALLGDSVQTGNEALLADSEAILIDLSDQFMPDDTAFADVQEVLGDVRMEQGRYAEAIADYNSALAADPVDLKGVQIKLGRAQAAAGDLDRAETTLNEIVVSDPYSIDALIAIGEVYSEQGRNENALNSFRDALSLTHDATGQPVSPEVRTNIAERVLELAPDDIDTKFTLAQIYLNESILTRAIEIYESILADDPTSWLAQKGLAGAYQQRTEFQTALEFYQSALQNDPPSSEQIAINNEIIQIDTDLMGSAGLSEVGQEAIFRLAQIYTDLKEEIQAREQIKILQDEHPDFDPERVAELVDFLNNSRPGDYFESEGRRHLGTGEAFDDYQTNPPTSGPHIGNRIADYGISEDRIPDSLQIHNLEHGAVIIQYDDLVDQPIVDQITDFVSNLRTETRYCRLILAPNDDLDDPIALTAWTRILTLETFDEETMQSFIDEFINNGPEDIDDCRL